jgi:hypothetical protein
VNTHDLIIDFGKHKGERWTRVPVNYLKWILNEPGMVEEKKAIAKAEMERRGSFTPDLEVSGHAIDRASLMLRKTWHETALSKEEGLHAWLCRMSQEALENGEKLESGKIRYMGMKFAFKQDGCWPVLKTVSPA